MTSSRLLVVAAAAVVGALTLPAAADAATLRGPRIVESGERVTFRLSGFPAGQRISVTGQPAVNVGGNGVGVDIGRVRADRRGRARLRVTFPRRYQHCAGASDCTGHPWRTGTRVKLFAVPRDYSVDATRWVRIAR